MSKRNVIKNEHAIIHTGKVAPMPSPDEMPFLGESAMLPHAIRVDSDKPGDKLDEMSRRGFGHVHTIAHNLKVKSICKVNRNSEEDLVVQFRIVWDRDSKTSHAGEEPKRDFGIIRRNASRNGTEFEDAEESRPSPKSREKTSSSNALSTACANNRRQVSATPSQAACEHGHAKIVKLLIDRGAMIDAMDESAYPLRLAAEAGHREVVELLLDAGRTHTKMVKWPAVHYVPLLPAVMPLWLSLCFRGMMSRGPTLQKTSLEDCFRRSAAKATFR